MDYEKAFDSVQTQAIFTSLQEQGIEDVYIVILKVTVHVHKESEKIRTKRGVRQGDTISPKLFPATLESIFRRLNWESKGVKIEGQFLSNLRFAGDIFLCTETPQELQHMMQELSDVSRQMEDEHRKDKGDGCRQHPYKREQCADRKCPRLRVLGTTLQPQGKEPGPAMTYGAETWTLTKQAQNKLAAAQTKMERSLLNITYKDRRTNIWVMERTKVIDIMYTVRTIKWSWAGHINRLKDNRWTSRVTTWRPYDKKRRQGRPAKQWRDDQDKYWSDTI